MKRIFFIAVMCIFLNAQELEDSIYLHYGFNLISFNILPEDTSLGNVFSSVDEGDINIVIGEGVGAVYIPSIGWVGSLSDIDPRKGYWVGALRDQFLFIEGYPVDTYQDYFLNSGPNLISYPFDLPININQALPSSVVWNINSIIGESVAATNVNGQFLGSLEDFYPKKGYWFIAENQDIMNYNNIEAQCNSLINQAEGELEDIFFNIYNDSNISDCFESLDEDPSCIDEVLNFDEVISIYEDAVNICPDSPAANFGLGITSLLSIVNNSQFLDLIESWSEFFNDEGHEDLSGIVEPGLGLSGGNSFSNFGPSAIQTLFPYNGVSSYSMLFEDSREEIPQLQDLQSLIEDVFLERTSNAIESLDRVVGNDYRFIITSEMQGDFYQSDLEMDDTEFYLLKSYLHFFKAFFHVVATYNVDDGELDFEYFSWMEQDSDFLTIRPGMEYSMAEGHEELYNLHGSLRSALDFLDNESDWQGNDIIDNDILEDANYEDIESDLDDLMDFIEGDYEVDDYFCSEWDCNMEESDNMNVLDFDCECTETFTAATVVNINNFMNNPPSNLKQHMPAYSIETSECYDGLYEDGEWVDYYYFACPQLIWEADSFYEWVVEWSEVDYSVNGLFPDIGLYEVLELYFLLFNVDEDNWSPVVGGN